MLNTRKKLSKKKGFRAITWLCSSMLLLGIIAAGFVVLPRLSSAHAAAPNPVLLIHGFSDNCGASMSKASTYLQGKGLTTVNLGYYTNEAGCNATIKGVYGPISAPNSCSTTDAAAAQALDQQKTVDTDYPIEKLGYHLAWYIYQNYTLQGISVDLVVHSMGGLIIRSAIAQTVEDHSGNCAALQTDKAGLGPLPPNLLIGRVATISTPHDGAAIADFDPFEHQAIEMKPGSQFIQGLKNTEIGGDAQWLTIGENCGVLLHSDGVVSASSAAWPDGLGAAVQRVTYTGCTWVHTSIEKDTSNVMDQKASVDGVAHTGCDRSIAMANNWLQNAGLGRCTN